MPQHHCDGEHNHDDSPEMGIQYSLYEKIDKENLQCLNEATEGSGKNIFKPWENRLDFSLVRQVMFIFFLFIFYFCYILVCRK